MSSFDYDPHNCRYVYFHRCGSNRPLHYFQYYIFHLTDLYRHYSAGSNPLPTGARVHKFLYGYCSGIEKAPIRDGGLLKLSTNSFNEQ